MIGAGPFSRASSSAASQPATRHLARHVLGELHRLRASRTSCLSSVIVRAEAQEAHAVAALAHDLVALLLERQAVDLDDVVEHAREHVHDLAVFVPVECAQSANGCARSASGSPNRAGTSRRAAAAVRHSCCHETVKDQIVLVRLRRIEHGLATDVLDASDRADELLASSARADPSTAQYFSFFAAVRKPISCMKRSREPEPMISS